MLYQTLLQRLREFFVNVEDANVDFHLGDLFDPSHFRLRDVFLKTELINALHLPFELQAAYIGNVKVEGVLGFVAGSPLTIGVDNVCLVVGHKPVDWNNELALRYAKELLLAILQLVPELAVFGIKKNGDASSFSESPKKWILGKLLARVTETTVRLERFHIRYESEHEGQTIAYGAHIPLVELSSRDIGDQILQRREQPGVKYPYGSDNTASKRLYLGNISLYCDLHATSFLGPSPPKLTTPRNGGTAGATPTASLPPPLSTAEKLAYLRLQCRQPFPSHADRDLVLISAVWIKADFVRSPASTHPACWIICAIDVVTEEVKVDVDLTQVAALNDELARVAEFFQHTQRRAWRPSSVNRELVAPLHVEVASTSLLPVMSPKLMAKLSSADKPARCLSRSWLRGMWRYAAHCVLVAARRGKAGCVKLGAVAGEDEQYRLEVDREQYVELYQRSLSQDAIHIAVLGRQLLPPSPRATQSRGTQQPLLSAPLPVYEPLTLTEQWELSDLVERLAIREQRELRQRTLQLVRQDYSTYERELALALVPSPTASDRSSWSLVIQLPDEQSESVDRHDSGCAPSSPKPGSSATSSPAKPPLPLDFVAHHHHHFTRARAASSPAGSPTKLQEISLASPAPSPTPTHPHLTHSASLPVGRRHSPTRGGTSPSRKHLSLRSPPSPTAFSKQQWLVESILPPWLLYSSRPIPLINWRIGPISMRLHRRTPVAEATTGLTSGDGESLSSAALPRRSSDTFMELHLEGCTGCLLLCHAPSVSFLVEARLGRVHASLVDSRCSVSDGTNAGGNTIRTDYIREPSDGFLYLGLRYNFKHAARAATPPVADQELWDVKAKLCVGPIHIEYNEQALQTAFHISDLACRAADTTTPPEQTTTMPDLPAIWLDSASCETVVKDVLSNWKTFVHRTQSKDAAAPTGSSTDVLDAEKKRLKQAAKRARVTKFLNALMQQSSCIEVVANGIELHLSMLTRHVVDHVAAKVGSASASADLSHMLPLADSEQVLVTLPRVSAGLQNRPPLNECQLHADGARLKFRTTKQGRAAVVALVLGRLFPPPTSVSGEEK